MRPSFAIITVVVAWAACGDDDGGSSPVDAGAPADAASPDAAASFDAAAPDASTASGDWFVMATIRVPESANQAVRVALDLDGNGQPDNALGGLLAALHNQTGMPFAQGEKALVGNGGLLQLVGIEVSQADPDVAAVEVSRGADLDDDPADNFSGVEPFALDPVDPADGHLEGALAAGVVRAGPGAAQMPLAVVGVDTELVWLRGVGARVRANVSDDGLAGGRLCGGLLEAEIDTVLIPALATAIDDVVQLDCPGGVCEPGTPGEQLAAFFDENEDGMVPVEEFRSNSLIESTIGNPDLDLFDADGVFNPRVDGIKDSLSFCLGFAAVGAVVDE